MTYFATLTGFEFIGERIYEFEKSGSHTFMFGYEESYGYLKGTYARDKDAVVASMITAEMAAYYAQQGVNLYEVMQSIMKKFRTNAPQGIGNVKTEKIIVYLAKGKSYEDAQQKTACIRNCITEELEKM